MRKHEPAVLEAVERSFVTGRSEVGDVHLEQSNFAAAPRISFDKAVLERHVAVAVTALDAMWRDVGTWAEVAELYPADADGNRQRGRVHLASSRDSFVFSLHRLTVGIGLKDLVVVDTPDALLIANRNELGLVREVVAAMTAARYPEVAAGSEQIKTRRISIGAGEAFRGEPHQDSARHWIVLQGKVTVKIGSETSTYGVNESFHVPPGTSHIVANGGSAAAKVLEVYVDAKNSG